MAQEEMKRFEEQNEQHKQEIQQFVQSLDEQRSLLAEFELKFRVRPASLSRCEANGTTRLAFQESQNRCTELENERQRIQNDFENYYQHTHQLEELQQQKSVVNNNSDSIEQVNHLSHPLARTPIHFSARSRTVYIVSKRTVDSVSNPRRKVRSQ